MERLHLYRRSTTRLKCDKVQIPPRGPFRSAHLLWTANTVWIPKDRLADFIEGEEHRPSFNCQFKIRSTEEVYQNESRYKTIRRYWCCYGPNDLRKPIDSNLPDQRKYDNGKVPLRNTTLTGKSVRRGCLCHFSATRFEDRPDAILVEWKQKDHIDNKNKVCHGMLDPTAMFANAHIAPRLSARTKAFVERLLRAGVKSKEIIKAHFENLRNHFRLINPDDRDDKAIWTRDMQLCPKDVNTIRESLQRRSVNFSTNDACSVRTWHSMNKDKVICFQDKTTDCPFQLAISTPWMLKKAARLGHNGALAMDATFGTNTYEYSLFTLLAYDEFQNGLPVAWAIMEKSTSTDLAWFLKAFKDKVEETRLHLILDREFKPNCWLIDVASEEILAIKNVFPGVPITLCLWHVRRAWSKNLMTKVKDPFHKAAICKELGDLMYNTEQLESEQDSIDFINRWCDSEPTFIAYYESYWHKNMVRWAKKFRSFPHANQNTNGAIERWHRTLKTHLKSEKSQKSGRSVIWLLHMLVNDMELFYWCMLSLKFQGRIRNKIKEQYIWSSIHKARAIKDEDVTQLGIGADGIARATVCSVGKPNVKHLLENIGLDNCTCTCLHSQQGNICKHQVKCLLLDGYAEMTLFNLLGTKAGTMCGGLDYDMRVMTSEQQDDYVPEEGGIPSEVDISFPLKTFGDLEGEDEGKDGPPIPRFSEDYWIRLVKNGYAVAESSPTLHHEAVIKLREWLEWLKNEEARQEPPNVQDLPTCGFERVEGADGSLVRRRSIIDNFWEKQKHKGRKNEARGYQGILDGEDTKDELQDSDLKDDKLEALVNFAKKPRRKESMQQMFDRSARESLNLNLTPMDYEAPVAMKGKASASNKANNIKTKKTIAATTRAKATPKPKAPSKPEAATRAKSRTLFSENSANEKGETCALLADDDHNPGPFTQVESFLSDCTNTFVGIPMCSFVRSCSFDQENIPSGMYEPSLQEAMVHFSQFSDFSQYS